MRRVAAVEMIGLYLALALVPYAIWRWRQRSELYTATLYSLGMLLIFGSAVTNIGVLYRLRYGFVMTLAALGIATVVAEWYERQEAPGGGRRLGVVPDSEAVPRPR